MKTDDTSTRQGKAIYIYIRGGFGGGCSRGAHPGNIFLGGCQEGARGVQIEKIMKFIVLKINFKARKTVTSIDVHCQK